MTSNGTTGFSIVASIGGAGYYWTTDGSGTVIMRPTSVTSTDKNWSVRNGILFYSSKQLFFNIEALRFTTSAPLKSPDYSSPVVLKECGGSSCTASNWIAVVTSSYPLKPPTDIVPEYDLSTSGVQTNSQFPVVVTTGQGGIYYPTVANSSFTEVTGRAHNPPLYSGNFHIYMTVGGQNVEVPLTGLIQPADLGTAVVGKAAAIDVLGNTAATTVSGWWILVPVILVLVLAVVFFLVMRSKKVVETPLFSDPLVQTALVERLSKKNTTKT